MLRISGVGCWGHAASGTGGLRRERWVVGGRSGGLICGIAAWAWSSVGGVGVRGVRRGLRCVD